MRVLNKEELAQLLYETEGEATFPEAERATMGLTPAVGWLELPEHARDDYRAQATLILKVARVGRVS